MQPKDLHDMQSEQEIFYKCLIIQLSDEIDAENNVILTNQFQMDDIPPGRNNVWRDKEGNPGHCHKPVLKQNMKFLKLDNHMAEGRQMERMKGPRERDKCISKP